MNSLIALVWLPNLLEEHSTIHQERIYFTKARHFKAKVPKHAIILEKDLKNPLIVRESRPAQSTVMPTKYDFCREKAAFRYCLFWTMEIIANCILERFEDEESSHAEETQSAAENICKPIEYLHHLKPVGVPLLTFLLSMAFGVSLTS